MGTVTNVLVPVNAAVYVGTYVAGGGSPSYTAIGYTQEGVEFTIEVETNEVEVAEEVKPLDRYIVKETLTASVTLAETSLAVLGMCLPGATINGNKIEFSSGVLQKVAVKIEWTDQYGGTHIHYMNRATPSGTITRKINRKTGLVGYQVTFIDLATETGAQVSNEDHTMA